MPEAQRNSLPDAGRETRANPSVILVATDLSDLDRLMPFALEQATETGARLILLHVVGTGAALATDAVGMPYYSPAGAIEFATQTLEPWCALASRENMVCEGLVREGNPAQQIAAVIRQFRVDRVLLGTRSRSRLGKLLLGSVAEQVLRSANLPVMTVGPAAHAEEIATSARAERVILHATTLRENACASAELACRIAAKQGARLLLMHVLPALSARGGFEESHGTRGQSGQAAGPDSAALQELSRMAAQLAAGAAGEPRCPAIAPQVVHGNPAIEILAAAAGSHANLIVLGATARSAFANLTRDRTIYRVLAHARCPVLTLREVQVAPAAGERQGVALHFQGQEPIWGVGRDGQKS